jgi:SSS family solute:Na+ symporter
MEKLTYIDLAVFIAYKFFVPYYRKSVSISGYEELEKRFGYWARLYANTCFLAT